MGRAWPQTKQSRKFHQPLQLNSPGGVDPGEQIKALVRHRSHAMSNHFDYASEAGPAAVLKWMADHLYPKLRLSA